MNILGLNFTNINAERIEGVKGKINIKNNVTIKDISEVSMPTGKEKQKILKFIFEFTCNYEPKAGSITLMGDLMLMDEAKKIEKVVSDWKKDKKIGKETITPILNTVLSKCNIQALILSQQINLPPPIPLPKVDANTKQA